MPRRYKSPLNPLVDTTPLHHDPRVLRIMARSCHECLYGPNKIVTDRDRDRTLAVCEINETHFICHKASNQGHDVMCRGHWERTKDATTRNRLARELGVVVEVTEAELEEDPWPNLST